MISMTYSDQFVSRYSGSNTQDVQTIQNKINAPTLDALIGQTVPASIRSKQPLNLPEGMSTNVSQRLRGIAKKKSFKYS